MKTFLTILLCVSLLGNIVLFLQWQKERQDHVETIQKELEFLESLSRRMDNTGLKE